MANYNTLKTSVANVIKENGNNEITGNLLQQTLIAMINSLGSGYQFMGVAQPSTNPGTPDQRVFYIAAQPGTYPNFNAEVTPGEIGIFYYSTTWLKDSITAVDMTEMGFKGTFQSGIGLDPSDGEIIVDVNYDASDYIPVNNGYVIIYSGGETDSNRAAIVGYDENKYMVSVLLAGGQDRVNEIVTINDPDIKYVRVSSCNQNHENYATPFAYNIVATTDVLVNVQEMQEDIDFLTERLQYIQPIINVIREGYIFRGIGTPTQQYQEDVTDTFYWIETPGTYPGGVLAIGEVGLLVWDGSDWTIEKLNIATKTALAAMNEAFGTLSDTVYGIASVVVQILSVVAVGYEFIGEITPASVFPADTYQYKVMFLAQTPGTYNNHGRFTIADDEIALLCYDPASEEWSKIALDVAKKSVLNAALAEVEETYAKQNGEYPAMLVGSAMGIMGNTPQAALYTNRAVPAGAGSGAAQMRLLRGRSIVWNQKLIKFAAGTYTSNDVTMVVDDNGVITLNGTASAQAQFSYPNVTAVNGHKYLILTQGLSDDGRSGIYAMWDFPQAKDFYKTDIYTATADQHAAFRLRIPSGFVCNGNKVQIDIIDLTQLTMPDLTAPAFEALYPGFHGFNGGTIKNLTATGIKTTGFNQWDEEWELGDIDNTGAVISGNRVLSKDFIPVQGKTDYYFYQATIATGSNIAPVWYDANKNFISGNTFVPNRVVTSPARACYLKFRMATAYGTTYHNDICINISNPARNGQYEPYRSYTQSWPITTMTGKAGGVGESVVIYPDGMKSVDDNHFDYGLIDADGWWRKTNRVLLMVNLGDLTWTKRTGILFSAPIQGCKTGVGLIPNYTYRSNFDQADMSFNFAYRFAEHTLNLSDSRYSDADSLKAALNGVYCICELSTPIEYTLDTPIYMGYAMAKGGTETMLPDQTGQSEPTSAPIDYDVVYPIDAAGNLVTALNAMLTANSLSGSFAEDGNGGVIYES